MTNPPKREAKRFRMTQRARGIVQTRLILLGFLSLLLGCLPSDRPEHDLQESSTSLALTFDIAQTKAPLILDPRILSDRSFTQSPMWEREVSSGRLPPVSERLPKHPRVIIPFKEIGKYGGKIRRAITGDIVQVPATMKAKNEGLLTFSHPMGDSIEPNLAERWEFKNGGKELYGGHEAVDLPSSPPRPPPRWGTGSPRGSSGDSRERRVRFRSP